MLRAIILSLILFVAFGTLVPISTEYSEASVVTSQRKYKKKQRAERYRRMAMRQKRKKRGAVARRATQTSGKPRISTKRKSRRVTRRYRASSKARPRKSVRKKVRRSVAKRRVVMRSSASKRGVRRAVRSQGAKKRRYSANKRKRKATTGTYRKVTAKSRVQRKKGVRKYSKNWWASYRAKQQRRKAIASRKRSIRLTAIRLEKKKQADTTPASVRYERLTAAPSTPAAAVRTQTPNNLGQSQAASGEVSMEVVGTVIGETVTQGRNTAVGGVSTTSLRRTVIDQMIKESGWVENDFQKEVDGRKVYVVVAKAPDKNNRIKAKTYYFTESGGRIYRVAANSSDESAESAQKRSEEMIRTLDSSAKPQQAKN